MKQLTSAVLAVFIFLALFNCGGGKLTPEKAKEVIGNEVDAIFKKVMDARKDAIPEEDMKKVAEKIAEFKQTIKVSEIKQEEKVFIAVVEMKLWDDAMKTEMKFSKGGGGWEITEVKVPTLGEWMTKKDIVDKILTGMTAAAGKDKLKATMGDMKSIGMAIESYITDNYKAPGVESMAELKKMLEPFYIKTLPLEDAWGNEFHYLHGTGEQQDVYAVGSGGSDGKFDGFEQKGTYSYTEGKDIIFSSGEFTFCPEIK